MLTFFTPLFAVSCGTQKSHSSFSGFNLSTANITEVGAGFKTNLNALGFIIIILPAVLFILSFFINRTKSRIVYDICKTIFFIIPISNIFIIFIIKTAIKAILIKILGSINLYNAPVDVNIRYGFILYIIFNAVLFIFAVINYFVKP